MSYAAANQSACFENFPFPAAACTNRSGSCRVVNATYSSCLCPAGFRGALCTEMIVPLTWTNAVCGTFYFLFFALCITMTVRAATKGDGPRDVDEAVENAVTPWFSRVPRVVLVVYRFVFFVYVWGFLIDAVARSPTSFAFYTVQTFTLLGVYMLLGLILSVGNLLLPRDTYAKWFRVVAALHLLALHMELPNSLLVDVVTWAILLPTSPPGALLGYGSIVMHITNFFIVSFDFLLSSHVFQRKFVWATFAWAAWYCCFELVWTLARDSGGHRPTYFFLDASSPFLPLWILLLLFIVGVASAVVWFTSWRCLGRRPKWSRPPELSDVANAKAANAGDLAGTKATASGP